MTTWYQIVLSMFGTPVHEVAQMLFVETYFFSLFPPWNLY